MSGAASTDQEVRSGLVGVVSHRSSISSIIGTTLTYRGINIDELADNGTFEEIVHLLWEGSLPTKSQLDELSSDLRDAFELPPAVIAALETMPKDADPMRVQQAGMALLGMHDPDRNSNDPDANRRKAVRATSQLTALTCAFHRLRRGEAPVAPSKTLNFAGNFVYQLNGRDPDAIETEAVDKALILHADHRAQRLDVLRTRNFEHALGHALGAGRGDRHPQGPATWRCQPRGHGGAQRDRLGRPCRFLARRETGQERENHGLWPPGLQRR